MIKIDLSKLDNCTSNIPSEIESINQEVHWIIEPIQSYEISGRCFFGYQDGGGDFREEEFTVSEDKKKAEFKGTIYANGMTRWDNIVVEGSAIYVQPEVKVYGSINPYVVTDKNLEEFANVRFGVPSNGEVQNNIEDLADFVHSIKRTYVKDISLDLDTSLWCGDINTQINCKLLKEPRITLDFGEVLIPNYTNSRADFENTEIELFLPFSGFVNISNDFVGTKLKVIYKLDLISSSGVIFLYSNEMLIRTINCEPYSSVIFRKNEEFKGVLGSLTNDSYLLYDLKPFIKIKRYDTKNNEVYNPDSRRVVLRGLQGSFKFKDVDYNLVTDAITQREVEMINNLLINGVLII